MATYTKLCNADAGMIDNTGSNYGSSSNWSLDYSGTDRWVAINWDLSDFPSDPVIIDSAYVTIHKYSGGNPTVYARRYTGSWSEGTITDANEPSNVGDGDGSVYVGASGGYNVPCTQIVKQWYENGASKYGMRLHASAGSLTYFRSRESTTAPGDRAQLVIVYTLAPTAPPIQFNVNDSWKTAEEVYVNINDVWREVTEAYVNIGDVWRQIE
ncbi:MAG: DNRLRE domain-containing protein [Candidatus Bathyarchaeota archaeon]|nr:DNRLRE domain-containing protein [Candidatus Bathyarchaeota archaeon]